MDLDSLIFALKNSFVTKKKKKGHVAQNWILIEKQIEFNLIWTFRFLHIIIHLAQKLKIRLAKI